MTAESPVRSASSLDSVQVSEIRALATRAAAADGVAPLSESVLLRVRGGGGAGAPDSAVHLMSRAPGGALAGYAYVDLTDATGGPAAELVVDPPHRRRGVARALLGGVIEAAEAADPRGRLRFWAHGNDPGARALAEQSDFVVARVLWQMRRALIDPLPDAALPEGVVLRTFRPGQDDAAWLTVNARAFAHHPEQGRWTVADLRLRLSEPWFDPAGFLLAVDSADDRLIGFHWTKVHPGALGEVYVLGVDPGGHRRGLGAALSVAGLRHLRDRGLAEAMLYVDESNPAAVALYRRLGFAISTTDVSYQRRR